MRRISLRYFVLVVLFISGYSPAVRAAEPGEDAAVKAAADWLAIADAGKYEDSWDAASAYVKMAMIRDYWANTVKAARAPLGKVISRTFKSAHHRTSLSGAPDGDYMVMLFETSFEHKAASVEMVTTMIDKDGKWRVAGYYIR